MSDQNKLDETILDDDYPVYASYAYVVDGTPISSPLQGTVRDLKRMFKVQEVTTCDLGGRGFFDE